MIAGVRERHTSLKVQHFISPEVLTHIYKEVGVPLTATSGRRTTEDEGSEQEGEVMEEEIEPVDDDDDIYM